MLHLKYSLRRLSLSSQMVQCSWSAYRSSTVGTSFARASDCPAASAIICSGKAAKQVAHPRLSSQRLACVWGKSQPEAGAQAFGLSPNIKPLALTRTMLKLDDGCWTVSISSRVCSLAPIVTRGHATSCRAIRMRSEPQWRGLTAQSSPAGSD